MSEFLHDVRVLYRKEMRMILKDPRSRFILIMPILIQSLIFGYVATYDLNLATYALLDEDKSASSRELIARFDGSKIFQRVATLENSSKIAEVIDNKKAMLALHIGVNFESDLISGQAAPVQIIVDGRNANVAGIASAYAGTIIDTYSQERLRQRGGTDSGAVVSFRAWFNPNLETRWNLISGMVGILAIVQVLLLTALSVAREKEQGTFDQLLVTPFSPMVILTGKALPSVIIGLVQSAIVLAISLYWFKIPFAGSHLLFFSGLVIFNLAVVGIGLCVSALTSTMQQAMLYAFSLIMPMILLSGFATPISSMPEVVQLITFANPVRYGVEFTQRIYLEGAGAGELYNTFWPLLLISGLTLGAASRLFRERL